MFELQDQITDKVIGIVEPSLQRSEIERSRRKPPENLDAYDLYLRAVPHTASRKLEDARIAAGFLGEALKLDPNYAAAHALLALCRQMFFIQGGLDEADKLAGLRHARAAIAGAGDDASALAVAALVIGHLGWDHEAAIGTIRNALVINPSSATAHYFAAHIFAFSGDYVTGTVHADRALRLSPFDPLAFEAHTAFAIAALHEGRFAEAASWSAKAAQVNAGSGHFVFTQAASLALAGRVDEGRRLARQHLLHPPSYWIRGFSQTGLAPEIVDQLAEGARLLGELG